MTDLYDEGGGATAAAPKKRLDQPEHRLSHYVDVLFDRVVMQPAYYTAVDHSGPVGQKGDDAELRRIKRLSWEQHQRWMGIKPDQLDWYLVQFDPVTFKPTAAAWIELKWGSNPPTTGQLQTIEHLTIRGQVCGVARTIAGCLSYLVTAGCRLHSNAENIAKEIQMRLDAAHAAAPAKLAKRAAAKPRKPRVVRVGKRGISTSMMVLGR
jgi:hypothetical protein